MRLPYYAHTKSGCPETEWEPLARHLSEVAEGAAGRASRFGGQSIAEAAGLLHDLGKYAPDFQARLRGSRQRADHSTAGAVWASRRLPRWGWLIAHVVAGHHAGLQDGMFASTGRIQDRQALLAPAEAAALADGIKLPSGSEVGGPEKMVWSKRDRGFQNAFLTRMIFSCLIDADRSAAAAFEAQAAGTSAEGHEHPTMAALEAELLGWIANRSISPSEINGLRSEIFEAALAKAAEPQGAFTLTVPTGGGKTLSSLAFALAHARTHGLDRMVVVIPFTSIIEQTAQVFRTALGRLEGAVLEHHSAFDMEKEAKWASERIGPDRLRLAMGRWDSPIVVTTAVQFFESLFSNRPSRCRKLHSLARSVIVLDEAQTMPLPLLRPCVAALKELVRNYGASVVLCTATQPALQQRPAGEGGFEGGFEKLEEIAPDVPRLFAALRRVTVRDIGVQDDAALAARFAQHNRALCIVNQRAHARALFQAIRHLPGARHLSTCMHSVHRSRALAEIRADLKAEKPCRVVATSLVEAGVDVDFPHVLRATAGLDQLAQAAGRCNREFLRTPEASEVLVFKPAEHGVIRRLLKNAEAAEEIFALYPKDPFGPAAMCAYFNLLYWRIGKPELDRGRVMETCAERAADLNFPFESIAADMRFIDDTMVPVIVGKEEAEAGEVDELVRRLRCAGGVGGLSRKLQRYTVGVPRSVRSAMIAQGAAEIIHEERYGDQFVVLQNLDLYTAASGLDWSDLTFRNAENMIPA